MKAGGQAVVWLGFLMHAIAWLLPAVRGVEVNNPVFSMHKAASWAMDSPEWLPGWMAFRFAWTAMIGNEPLPNMSASQTTIVGSTCLTNAVMALALLIVLFGPRNRDQGERYLFGWLALGCVVLNASWLCVADKELVKALSTGYYLWLASFLVVGLGLLASCSSSVDAKAPS